MKNFVESGKNPTVAAPAGGVISGKAVLIGGLFGVASVTVAEGEDFALVTEGIFDLAKTSTNTFAVGDPVYFKASTVNATSTATNNVLIGTATAVAASGDLTVRVRLNGVHIA